MRTSIAVLILGPLLVAQDAPAGDQLLRGDDVLVVACDGPERLVSSFVPTNLGTLIGAKEAAGGREALVGAVRSSWEELAGDEALSRETVHALVDALSEYGGRIHLGVGVVTEGQHPIGDAALVFASDEKADGTAVRDALARAIREIGGDGEPLVVGEISLSVVTLGPDVGVTLPFEVGGGFAIVAGQDIEAAVRRRLGGGAESRFVADADFAAASFAAEIDTSALMRVHPVQEHDRVWIDAFGISAVEAVRFTARPRGPHVQLEGCVRFASGADRGVLGGLMPDVAGPPKLAAFAPSDAAHWYAGKVRVTPIYRGFVTAIAGMFGGQRTYEEVRAETKESLGFDVEDDLLAHVGEDFVAVGVLAGADPDAEEPHQPASYLAIQLADTESFRASWQKLFESEDFATEFAAERRGELEVHVGMFGWFAWAIDGDVLALAVAEDPAPGVFEFLEQRRAVLARGEAGTDLPKHVARVERAAPPGMQGAGTFHAGQLFARPVLDMLELDDLVPAAAAEAAVGVVDEVRPLLEQYGLARPVAFAGWKDDRWTYRVVW